MASTHCTCYERVDEVLNSEDGIILLVDRRHSTSYLQGFALSGCQIELLSVELERAVRALAPGQWAGDRRTCHDEPDEGHVVHRSHGPESERWPRVAKEAPQKDLYNLGDFGTLQPWSARRDSASGWRRCCRT